MSEERGPAGLLLRCLSSMHVLVIQERRCSARWQFSGVLPCYCVGQVDPLQWCMWIDNDDGSQGFLLSHCSDTQDPRPPDPPAARLAWSAFSLGETCPERLT